MKTLATLVLTLGILPALVAQFPYWTLSSETFEDVPFSPVEVAINGDYAVLSSFNYNNSTGAAAVFQFNGTDWEEVQLLIPSDGEPDDWFGLGVAIEGTKMLIGAPSDNFQVLKTGKAYAYELQNGSWVEMQIIQPPTLLGSAFGFTMDMNGEHAVVGAPDNDFGNGAAVIYQYVDGAWEEDAVLLPPPATNTLSYGAGVAISGDWVAIGGYLQDANFQHAVFLYQLENDDWTLQQTIVNEESLNTVTTPSWSVDLDGDRLIFGYRHPYTGVGDVLGGAKFFQLEGDIWVEESTITDPVLDDNLIGRRVAMSEQFALTGLAEEPAFMFDSAHQVLFFQRAGVEWIEVGRVRMPSGGLNFGGVPMEVTNEFAIIGSPDVNEAYVYDLRGLVISGTSTVPTFVEGVVYPNPASGILNISTIPRLMESVILFDNFGRIVRQFEEVNSMEVQLEVADLPAGIYYTKLSFGDSEEVHRVVIEK